MPIINLEKWRARCLPEEDSPKLTDSYIKKLLCQWSRRRGISLQSKNIPDCLVVQKREEIKQLRFNRQVAAKIKELESKK